MGKRQKPARDWSRELEVVREAIWEAGQEILKRFKTPVAIRYKGVDNPVTEADLQSNEILKSKILSHFPNDGWLSEETKDNRDRLKKERVWIVDPMDGTKEFAQGIPEFAISVALTYMREPVVACVHNPATDEMFTAVAGQGAYKNGVSVRADRVMGDRPLVLASRSEVARGEWDRFKSLFRVRPVGSIAYKMALVAGGEADITFSLGTKNEWDVAAGVLLVEEAGGRVFDSEQKRLQFNKSQTLVSGVIAATMEAWSFITRWLQSGQLKERAASC
ncbi:MAG: 3'(2'),5'-bisphosphate nucleotidase CysQ [Armatimonadetes bacterium]|nr:3'(2'),5'-bisphosphate nucleotidase CysQ [Armatimonadota bacterium]MDW8121537.1 3'(2'),5'-bisphosphate nucleotidase CysQ [Armatimonadota bacterium]